MTTKPEQVVGGALLPNEGGAEVSVDVQKTQSNRNNSIISVLWLAAAGVLIYLNQVKTADRGVSITPKCDSLPARGRLIGTRLARQDEPADLDGILDTVLEIAAKRREILGRLRQAVKANSVREVLDAAKELCGLYDETSDRVN